MRRTGQQPTKIRLGPSDGRSSTTGVQRHDESGPPLRRRPSAAGETLENRPSVEIDHAEQHYKERSIGVGLTPRLVAAGWLNILRVVNVGG